MPRTPRTISATDIYHLIVRGSGKQLIFEDDEDRLLFLRLLDKYLKELGGKVFAWILMGNHVHLVLHMPLEDIGTLMRKLGATYCRNLNDKTEKTGHVLQGRFHSEAINSNKYFMTCVRYVHQNIEKAGACRMEDYLWSSYRQYAGHAEASPVCIPLEVEKDFVLAVFDGLDGFRQFHALRDYAVPCIDVGKTGQAMTDSEALIYAKSLLGEETFHHLRELDKPLRNEKLRQLKEGHLSIRQIERLTGIGYGIVARS